MKNPVFELQVAAGGSGTPPIRSSVFVSVFGMHLELKTGSACGRSELSCMVGIERGLCDVEIFRFRKSRSELAVLAPVAVL